MAVVPDDDDHGQRISDEEEQRPSRSQTPPTPPGEPDAAHSPPPSHRPIRQRAMAQLRPVSIPNIVCDVAGPDPLQKIAAFDRHYMPDGQPEQEASSRGNSDAHRSELKLNAEGISRSLSEVFAYLTHCTASLVEARKLLSIITNVHQIMLFMCFIFIIYIMTFMCFQLDFQPADIKHSSLRTMAKHVRRAMLPGNHEVFKRSFAEGNVQLFTPLSFVLPLMLHHAALQTWMENRSWIFTGQIRLMP